MSDASKINSKQFIQEVEQKKQLEAQKEIEDVLNKLQNPALTGIQLKYEIAKLNTITNDVHLSNDLKEKISDTINKLGEKEPNIKELLEETILKAIEEIENGFTGEGISTAWANKDTNTFFSNEEYDPYKIDGNSTLSTYL